MMTNSTYQRKTSKIERNKFVEQGGEQQVQGPSKYEPRLSDGERDQSLMLLRQEPDRLGCGFGSGFGV